MEQLANNPVTTLNGAINNSVTTITVNSSSAFPSAGVFRIKVDNEVMKVTGVSGNDFTVVRGQEGTTAASHSNGASVKCVVTAETMYNLLAESYQIGPYSSRPTTVRAGTIYAASDANYRWRYNGTNWDLIHPTYVPYAKRVDVSSWTALNHGGSDVWTDIHGILNATYPVHAVQARGYYKALPSAPYKLTLAMGPKPSTHNRIFTGLGLLNTGTSQMQSICSYSNGGAMAIGTPFWNTLTSVSSFGQERRYQMPKVIYVQIEDNNTNWIFRMSLDGVSWTAISSIARNTGVTPNSIMIHEGHNNTQPTGATVDQDFFAYWEE